MKLSAVQWDVLAAVGRGSVWQDRRDPPPYPSRRDCAKRAVTSTIRSLVRLDLVEMGHSEQWEWRLTDAGRAVLLEGGAR